MLRLMLWKCFLKSLYKSIHIIEQTTINTIGSKAIKNILNMVEFGTNPFILVSWIKQSTDTNDSELEPIIYAGENKSFKISG